MSLWSKLHRVNEDTKVVALRGKNHVEEEFYGLVKY